MSLMITYSDVNSSLSDVSEKILVYSVYTGASFSIATAYTIAIWSLFNLTSASFFSIAVATCYLSTDPRFLPTYHHTNAVHVNTTVNAIDT